MRVSEHERLVQQLRDLRCPNPEAYAQMQEQDDQPQLARWSLIRWIWTRCIDQEDDPSWIDRLFRAKIDPGRYPAQMVSGLREMVSKGVSTDTIVDVCRCCEFEAIGSLLAFLEGSAVNDLPAQVGIFELSEDGKTPLRPVNILYSLMAGDPTGRELAPRESED